ncbi:MAG: sugar isomerase [Propionibacteriaceae bacterium]|jgi:fructoselysine-6-P-deglycase FrlB-like protein|nr:sugar isomerase [Propionibacteriaceae bacterium]
MSHVLAEIASQPACWRLATSAVPKAAAALPTPGERVAVIGCGTSWFMAMAYAGLREAAGLGWTDAFTASEFLPSRRYDRVIGISRSGTTTEVVRALATVAPGTRTTALVGSLATPVAGAADATVDLSFADERSVVQTRFATSVLAFLRAGLGEDLTPAIADAEEAVTAALPRRWADADQVAYVGQGWTVGLAQEAALKLREASQGWGEAYPAMDYRHGPIAIAQPGRIVWAFGPVPQGLADEVAATGAEFVWSPADPMADLIRAQRLAVARAQALGLDPDHPRNLTRSVVLAG